MGTNQRSLHSRKLALKKLAALILSTLFLQLVFVPSGNADLSDKDGATVRKKMRRQLDGSANHGSHHEKIAGYGRCDELICPP